jgi:bifunctional DNase/RNase
MKCQQCEQTATFHITEARQMAAVGERHLCEAHTRSYMQEHSAGGEPVAGQAPPVPAGEVGLDLVRLVINEAYDQQVMFLREVAGRRGFPVVIGMFEATNLDRRLKGLASPRPLTHDAWAGTIGALGGRVRDVCVNDHRVNGQDGPTYFAEVRIVQGDRVVAVDVRPSDGLALAVTLRVPVLVTGRLLQEVAGPPA